MLRRWRILAAGAPVAIALLLSAPVNAQAARLSLSGFGPFKWGTSRSDVESRLNLTFQCPADGPCACPTPSRALSVTLVFNQDDELTAAFGYGTRVRTTRGIHAGSTASAVQRRYRGARIHRSGALTSGLADFVLVRGDGHALAFQLNGRDKVTGIIAFGYADVTAELCG